MRSARLDDRRAFEHVRKRTGVLTIGVRDHVVG